MLLNVWLDDEPEKRKCPKGFIHVDNIDDIRDMLRNNEVDQLSLDHDLGVCSSCAIAFAKVGKDPGASCRHVPTGYDLVTWMEITDCWPRQKPIVHSRNPVGRERMQLVIDRSFRPQSRTDEK